ncbi:MAG TPA: CHAT domain-containing protein, partial [Pyrinomonadaceae bacterium]
LRKEGEPLWVDLGAVESVDGDLARLLAALKCPQTVDDIRKCPSVAEVKRLARAADERVMRPVRKLLGDTRHVFVSPDGALNLLPFAALVDENGKYLVETYSLTYLTSGRDLLRLQAGAGSREPPLVVADPAYDGARAFPTPTARIQAGEESARRSGEMGAMRFRPLPGTAAEAKALGAALPGVRVLTRERATEAALKQVTAPRVLHVATHGFFLPDQPQQTAAEDARGITLSGGGGPPVPARVENPLLRSGLALEGANQRRGAGGEDGILTALEAAALDLWGTKLVVLSACETGVGEVKNGEGVYGLRRALVLAGSESLVMSLWQVSDEATKDLMVSYYKRLLAGGGRTEALRQVQLEVLRGGGRAAGGQGRCLFCEPGKAGAPRDLSHPYYWAAFIQSGDWRGMGMR